MAAPVISKGLDRLAEPFEQVDLGEAYRRLRILIGVIGFTLCPIVMVSDHLINDRGLDVRGSVSEYYYGAAGNWFIGAVTAIGVFLFTYELSPRVGAATGNEHDTSADNLLSSVAAVCALLVAMCPIQYGDGHCEVPVGSPNAGDRAPCGGESVVQTLHYVGATGLLVSLAVFSLYHFTKTKYTQSLDLTFGEKLLRFVRDDPNEPPMTARKKIRNGIYRAMGALIVISLLVIPIAAVTGTDGLFVWAEVVAITAFGAAWLVKGDAFPFLEDPRPAPGGGHPGALPESPSR